MLSILFTGLFDTELATTISVADFMICITAALVLGLITSLAYSYKSASSKSFVMTLAILPALVTVVIMMVNGNIGAGVAVAGAFSLIRFRSAQGTAREIAAIFLTMGTGLIIGMGYIGYSALFTLIMCLVFAVYSSSVFKETSEANERTLRITIPEEIDYAGVFDEVFSKYTTAAVLGSVRTTNMGSMYKLRYDVTLKSDISEKEFIDKLRERNGNLEISMSLKETAVSGEL